MLLSLIGTVTALLVTYLILKEWRIYQRYANIPGPPGLPLIGNALQIDKPRPWITMKKWRKQYGDVFKFRVLGEVYVVANSWDGAYEMFESKSKDYSGREDTVRTNIISGARGIIRYDLHDPKWRLSRRLFHSSIKAFGPGLSRIEHYAQQLSEEFVETFKNSKGKPVDPLNTIFEATLGMISLMIYGKKLVGSSSVFQAIKLMTVNLNKAQHVAKDGAVLDNVPWVRYIGNEAYQLIKTAGESVDKVWSWYINDIAPNQDAELDESLGKPFMKVIRDYNKNCAPEDRLEPIDIRANAAQVTFAGVLTTTTTIYVLILELLHHPEAKKKLAKEIDEVIGSRTVSLNDRARMPYTNAVINETLRYCPPRPIHSATSKQRRFYTPRHPHPQRNQGSGEHAPSPARPRSLQGS
jgi:cytochrome P450